MEWMLPRITDYWDHRANAVFTLAQRLEAIDREDRGPHLARIVRCIEDHARRLSQEQLGTVAAVMADDLYRASVTLTYWDESLSDYLAASARTLLNVCTRSGYSLRYFIDNEFAPTPVGLNGPAIWFPHWFRAAGIAYICPQEIAYRRIEASGRRADSWTDLLSEELPEARKSADDALRRCRLIGTHFVYLDTDSTPDALDRASPDASVPGAIFVARSEAPHLSARIMMKVVPPSA